MFLERTRLDWIEYVCVFPTPMDNFVQHCVWIVRLRNEYITGYFRENPSQFKFKLLMQSRNISVMRNLSLFVGAILKMFR